MKEHHIIDDPYWQAVFRRFNKHRIGKLGLIVFLIIALTGIYAPFFASSKPLFVVYDNELYFPLFRYLFYKGFFTKGIDLFFNLLMFFLPVMFGLFVFTKKWRTSLLLLSFGFFLLLFFILGSGFVKNPEKIAPFTSFKQEIEESSSYARLNILLKVFNQKQQHEKVAYLLPNYIRELTTFQDKKENEISLPTLYQNALLHKEEILGSLKSSPPSREKELDNEEIRYIEDQDAWIKQNLNKLTIVIMPIVRPFHWEEEAGGDRFFNRIAPLQDKTRINRKDLFASLFFGIRISLVVGMLSVLISILIGIPIGAFAGYFAGKTDLVISRFIEIWESMPSFFMLLMIVAFLQSKSIFIVIFVIGIFGWTSFSRFIRGEFFKQRSLSYVDACQVLGLPINRIIFSHILPNAIPPVLTLLPFAIMGAVTAEAGLSFLGLGEEGSCSLGVLMDEGRSSFPGESYLLWPPAVLLTVFLIAIALIGDALRDTLDPKVTA